MLNPGTVSSRGLLFHIRFQIRRSRNVVEKPCVSPLDLHHYMPISLKPLASLVYVARVMALDLCTTQIPGNDAMIAVPRGHIECHDKYIFIPELEIAARLEGNHHRRDDDQRTSYCETHSTAPVGSPLYAALANARNNAARDCACSSRCYNKLTAQNITHEEI